ncbi:MAG: YcbK family protein [Alphaproteobacteria bacterium]|nr:YcbK family protein [Alphaproteobacteria bacterium]
MTDTIDGTRRRFLQMGLVAMACSVATPALAVMPRPKGKRSLAFHNLHTDERLQVTYWKDGAYSREALEKINRILRDHRTGDVYPMRPSLMDMVYDLQNKLKHHDTVEIISGYRSPKTNAMLASASDGVAKQSLHTQGMAIDLRLNGMSLRQVHNAALFMRRGGVGFYPSSGFVHMDVGRVRRW